MNMTGAVGVAEVDEGGVNEHVLLALLQQVFQFCCFSARFNFFKCFHFLIRRLSGVINGLGVSLLKAFMFRPLPPHKFSGIIDFYTLQPL